MSLDLEHSDLTPPPIEYPCEDGEPMGETGVHAYGAMNLYIGAYSFLRERQRSDVYLAVNQFVYFVEGQPKICAVPDFFAARGVDLDPPRDTYKTWVEGAPITLVVELTSRSTAAEDHGRKRALYEKYGVEEYFIFDPRVDPWVPGDPPPRRKGRPRPQLEGFVRRGGVLVPVEAGERHGRLSLTSEVLGLELHAFGEIPRWVHPDSGAPVVDCVGVSEFSRTHREIQTRLEASEKARSESEKARRESEKARRESEEHAEARERELLDEIARLRAVAGENGESS